MNRIIGIFASMLAFLAPVARADMLLSIEPASQTVLAGSQASAGIRISGLGNNTAPSVGALDIDLIYDPTFLEVAYVTFGDPALGDQLGFSASFPPLNGFMPAGPNSVNLFELSFDPASDLDSMQAGEFTWATVVFNATGVGTSPLSLVANAIADANGDSLPATLGTGSLAVTTVPEPSAWMLLGAVIGVAVIADRRSAQRLWKRGS